MINRILILDDDRDFARTMAEHLEAEGVQSPQEKQKQIMVDLAACSVEATTMININPPDLICLDIDLSHESGLAFCEYLAWNNEFSKIPIVVMTRRNDLESIRRSSTLDLHFVDKSIQSWDAFLSKIRGIMVQTKAQPRTSNSPVSPIEVFRPTRHIDMKLSGPFV